MREICILTRNRAPERPGIYYRVSPLVRFSLSRASKRERDGYTRGAYATTSAAPKKSDEASPSNGLFVAAPLSLFHAGEKESRRRHRLCKQGNRDGKECLWRLCQAREEKVCISLRIAQIEHICHREFISC